MSIMGLHWFSSCSGLGILMISFSFFSFLFSLNLIAVHNITFWFKFFIIKHKLNEKHTMIKRDQFDAPAFMEPLTSRR